MYVLYVLELGAQLGGPVRAVGNSNLESCISPLIDQIEFASVPHLSPNCFYDYY